MSYSFSVKAANKELAKQAVAAEFEKIIGYQPVHTRDCAAVLANANAVIDLLGDDETKDVAVSCNGYLSWATGTAEEAKFCSVNITCYASHADRA
jgi:DNA polymerase/3'-5' exonuclease PolX